MAVTVYCPFTKEVCTIYINDSDDKCYFDSLIGKKKGIAGQRICAIAAAAVAMVKMGYEDEEGELTHFG